MKNQLVIIGIVVILGSIVFSGCSGNTYTSSADIQRNPNGYINQTVVLKGQYFGEGQLGVKDSTGSFPLVIPITVKTPTPFVIGGVYVFTGIVRYGYTTKTMETGLYLEVTKIETL